MIRFRISVGVLSRPGHDRFEIYSWLRGRDSVSGRVSDGICGLGRFEQGLAGPATDPGAIAAQLPLLNQRNRKINLFGKPSRSQPGRAADNQ